MILPYKVAYSPSSDGRPQATREIEYIIAPFFENSHRRIKNLIIELSNENYLHWQTRLGSKKYSSVEQYPSDLRKSKFFKNSGEVNFNPTIDIARRAAGMKKTAILISNSK